MIDVARLTHEELIGKLTEVLCNMKVQALADLYEKEFGEGLYLLRVDGEFGKVTTFLTEDEITDEVWAELEQQRIASENNPRLYPKFS